MRNSRWRLTCLGLSLLVWACQAPQAQNLAGADRKASTPRSILPVTRLTGQVLVNGKPLANARISVRLVGNDSASLVGNDSASLVANGGGNLVGNDSASLVANGGGNLVGNDSASLVANGGGNLVGNDSASLVANGGGNLVGNDSASLVANGGGNLVGNDSASLITNAQGQFSVQMASLAPDALARVVASGNGVTFSALVAGNGVALSGGGVSRYAIAQAGKGIPPLTITATTTVLVPVATAAWLFTRRVNPKAAPEAFRDTIVNSKGAIAKLDAFYDRTPEAVTDIGKRCTANGLLPEGIIGSHVSQSGIQSDVSDALQRSLSGLERPQMGILDDSPFAIPGFGVQISFDDSGRPVVAGVPTPGPAVTPTPSPAGSLTPAPGPQSVLSAAPVVAPSDAQSAPPVEQWEVTTFVGGQGGEADGTGTAARFTVPVGIAVDSFGNFYVAESGNHRIRKLTPAGVVTTLAGGEQGYLDGDGQQAKFDSPEGVAVDGSGNVYVADTKNNRIRRVTPDGRVTTVAGGSNAGGFLDGAAANARFSGPVGIAVDDAGNVYVADTRNHCIRQWTPNGNVSTLAGLAGAAAFADGPAGTARFNNPKGIAIGRDGNLYVADEFNQRIRKVTPAGYVETLAGGDAGVSDGISSDDKVSPQASFNNPAAVAVDRLGNVYVADGSNHRIRKVTPQGVVTTLAGSEAGVADGIGSVAAFNFPYGVVIGADNNLYVSDSVNARICKLTLLKK